MLSTNLQSLLKSAKLVVEEPGSIQSLSSGSLELDYALGGGWAKGRLNIITGDPDRGKTTLALTTAAQVNRAGGNVVYIDMEKKFHWDYAARIGVDPERLALIKPDVAEDGLNAALNILYNANPDDVELIVIDGFGGIAYAAEVQGGYDTKEQTVGVTARANSRFIRALTTVLDKGITVIAIVQTRMNIGGGMPGRKPSSTMTGGMALRFNNTITVEMMYPEKHNHLGKKAYDNVRWLYLRPKIKKFQAGLLIDSEVVVVIDLHKIGDAVDNVPAITRLAKKIGLFTNKDGDPIRGSAAWHYNDEAILTDEDDEAYLGIESATAARVAAKIAKNNELLQGLSQAIIIQAQQASGRGLIHERRAAVDQGAEIH